ncbi:hypothetical protein FACS1894206_01270 [Deltaproteobacteria bacterium]|nr:hypothetical protein FACS1894206_01270 [Deltaproteobacteria bacterium]
MKKIILILFCFFMPVMARAASFTPDNAFLQDRAALDRLQRDAFRYVWEGADPTSGMVYESSETWDIRPVAVGGTGFGVAAIITAVDRGWITRDAAVSRLLTIVTFLRDKTPRKNLHGAFPHWLNGGTGEIHKFSKADTGADILETAMLMQGLLLARAYYNGPGMEETLRGIITELWEEVDWNHFTNGEENGLYWHWTPDGGFSNGLKILGYNECLMAYVLALASPTHPISRKAYDYWTSGKGYQPKQLFGYTVEASLPGGGPLFLAHYSFIGLDPRRMADAFVPGGYFARNVNHALSNREYCLNHAPVKNRYADNAWGLTASQIKGGYAANEPNRDNGVVAPTAALSSMPYTPHYSMLVLENLLGPLKDKLWGPYGPYDAFSFRDNWFSRSYLAIDQLPIVCMVENYRSGLLWRLFMADRDVQKGLREAGINEPVFAAGFPEAVPTVRKKGKTYAPFAYALRRHPDTGLYGIPYWTEKEGGITFRLTDEKGREVKTFQEIAVEGRNYLFFPQFMPTEDSIFTLTMQAEGREYTLPVILY